MGVHQVDSENKASEVNTVTPAMMSIKMAMKEQPKVGKKVSMDNDGEVGIVVCRCRYESLFGHKLAECIA